MKRNRTNQGFTLIELIMVIVILGILSAVVVPKFFDISTKAHEKNKEAVIGTIKSALEMYSAQQLVNNGEKNYPNGDSLEANGLDLILEKVPDHWAVQSSGATNDRKAKIVYSGEGTDVVWIYESPVGGKSDKYTLTKQP